MSADTYIPGTCNIGKGEVRRRQVVALIGAGLSVFTLVGLISTRSLSLAAILTLIVYLLPLN